jgi:hypothetical protein
MKIYDLTIDKIVFSVIIIKKVKKEGETRKKIKKLKY